MSDSIYDTFASALEKPSWRFSARPEQLPLFDDDWAVWLYLAGRSTGKTRAGAEAVREGVESGRYGRIGLIAPTAGDCREVMLHGPSGLLTISGATPPRYEPSLRKVTWEKSGAVAFLYSAEEAGSTPWAAARSFVGR
jgi:phage terminase large subunit-like protein